MNTVERFEIYRWQVPPRMFAAAKQALHCKPGDGSFEHVAIFLPGSRALRNLQNWMKRNKGYIALWEYWKGRIRIGYVG